MSVSIKRVLAGARSVLVALAQLPVQIAADNFSMNAERRVNKRKNPPLLSRTMTIHRGETTVASVIRSPALDL
mgnify:CR=1 FL=1